MSTPFKNSGTKCFWTKKNSENLKILSQRNRLPMKLLQKVQRGK